MNDVVFIFACQLDWGYLPPTEEEITAAISEKFSRPIQVESSVNGADIAIVVPIWAEDEGKMRKLFDEVLDVIEGNLPSLAPSALIRCLSASVGCMSGLPPFKINWPSVTLTASPGSISGISEKIRCDMLHINRPNLITGGVLDILRIDGLERFSAHVTLMMEDASSWVKIVSGCVGDDILACQEALIDAGLEEFATL